MKIVTINNKQYNFPESWDELTEKQLLQVMAVLFLKNYKAEEMLLQLVKTLAGLNTYQFFKADVAELNEFFYLTVFVLQPQFSFTKNLIPHYKHDDVIFYGPADGLSNLRMKEFTLTEAFYMQWIDSEKKDNEALHELLAILYRPGTEGYDIEKNPDGDLRYPFNQNLSHYHAVNNIHRWPPSVKLAIAHWYDGCRRAIVEKYEDVFSGSGDPAMFGLVSVMLSVAETNVFGPFAEVEEQHVDLVMMHLSQVVENAKKAEAQAKK